jgi:isomerase DpgB
VADDLSLRIDGGLPLSAASISALGAVCDRAEDRGGQGTVTVHVSGAPAESWTRDLTVAMVSKWERTLRRLECLAAATIAVASGDCGGAALDVLLTADYRIATTGMRLLVPVDAMATWPGMAMYRLSQRAGAARIRQAVLFGVPIEAKDALDLNLLDEVVDDPAEALASAVESVGAFSGPELAIRRQLMLNATSTSFEDALGMHLAACDRTLRRASAVVTP